MGRELLAHQIGKRMQARVEFDPADFESGSGNHVGVFVAYKETSGDVDWPVPSGHRAWTQRRPERDADGRATRKDTRVSDRAPS